MRVGAAWFALLALALPGFASVRGLCCEAELTKSSDCCASAMKMPGMDGMEMAASGDGLRAASPPEQCSVRQGTEVLEFVVPDAGIGDSRAVLTIEDHPAVTNRSAEISLSEDVDFFLDRNPPGSFLTDPLTVLLRI